jgi:hypothetical protein
MTMVSMRLMSGPQIQSPSAGPANTMMSFTCAHSPTSAATASFSAGSSRPPASRATTAPLQRTSARGRRGRAWSERATRGAGGRRSEAGAGVEADREAPAESRQRCADMAGAAAIRVGDYRRRVEKTAAAGGSLLLLRIVWKGSGGRRGSDERAAVGCCRAGSLAGVLLRL